MSLWLLESDGTKDMCDAETVHKDSVDVFLMLSIVGTSTVWQVVCKFQSVVVIFNIATVKISGCTYWSCRSSSETKSYYFLKLSSSLHNFFCHHCFFSLSFLFFFYRIPFGRKPQPLANLPGVHTWPAIQNALYNDYYVIALPVTSVFFPECVPVFLVSPPPLPVFYTLPAIHQISMKTPV